MRFVVYIVTVRKVFLLMLIYRLLLPFLPFIDALSLYQKDLRAVPGKVQTKSCCWGYRKTVGRKVIQISFFLPYKFCGPGSSVSIATKLRAGRYGNQIPVGARFSAQVQTGPGAHPASCTMGTRNFPGEKSGRGVLLALHSF